MQQEGGDSCSTLSPIVHQQCFCKRLHHGAFVHINHISLSQGLGWGLQMWLGVDFSSGGVLSGA